MVPLSELKWQKERKEDDESKYEKGDAILKGKNTEG